MKFILTHIPIKLAAWAGLIGPLLFVVAFTVEGWLRPDYNPQERFISELSLGPRGWVQITNFILFGGLFLVFSRGVAQEFQTGKASQSGPVLLTMIAISYFLSGPFVTDPATIFAGQKSVHGILHGIFGAIVFSLMPVSCFVFFRHFREDPTWQSLKWWTLTAGIIVSAAVMLLIIATKLPVVTNSFHKWLGLIQRAALVPYMVWLFVFALTVYKRNKRQ